MSTSTLEPTHLGWARTGPSPRRRPAGASAAPRAQRVSGPESRTLVRPDGGVRLSRRGRLVVFLASVAVVFAVAFFLGASSVATPETGVDAPTEVVTVGTGETLWELAAERTDPGDDVRDMMVRIERLNALESTALAAGQRLRVPAAR